MYNAHVHIVRHLYHIYFSSLQSVVIDFAYSQQNYTKKENLLIISKLLDNSQNHVENVIHVYDI